MGITFFTCVLVFGRSNKSKREKKIQILKKKVFSIMVSENEIRCGLCLLFIFIFILNFC